MLAAASKAIVIGFSVQADAAARRLAEAEGVSIRLYDIIYRMLEDIEKALKGMLEPELRETITGHAEVRQVFHISKIGNIAGSYILAGEIRRGSRARVIRAGTVIHESEISSLRHLQEDVREIRQGFECGIGIKGFAEFMAGDRIESYVIERIQVA
jgi:translation initiation factor IF-2